MIAEKEKRDFTQGRIFFKLILFVLPIIATNLLQTLYNAADMMIVSLSSERNAVGAIGTTSSFIHLIVHLFIGFSVGANVVVARAIGAKDEEKVRKTVHTAIIMSAIFGTIGGVIGIAVSRLVLTVMGNTGNLLELAVKYTCIYFAGVPFLAMTNYLIAIFRAKGDSKTPLVVLSAAGLLNVLLNLFFVMVVKLSVEGVALATSLANVASCIVLLWKLSRDRDDTAFSFKRLKIDKKAFAEIVYIGLPSGIQSALFSLSNILIQSSIVTVNNKLCPSGADFEPIVTGSAASANIEAFVYTAMNSVAQGAITLAGQNIGAGKPERVKRVLYNSYLLVLLIWLFTSGCVMIWKDPLLKLYGVKDGAAGSLDALAMQAATTRIWYICVPYFLCGLMDCGTYVLRGLGKSFISMTISLVGACLLRVVWLWTVFPFYQTLETIFICYPITWTLTGITAYFAVLAVLKKSIAQKQKEQAQEIKETQE